jgi:hypothetical protein
VGTIVLVARSPVGAATLAGEQALPPQAPDATVAHFPAPQIVLIDLSTAS